MDRKIISSIVENVKSQLKDERGVVSLTLVGSFANKAKKLEKFNDIDLVLILDKVTREKIKQIKNVGKIIKKRFESSKLGITSTLKIGPIKIKSNKKRTIMLHFLVYPLDKYNDHESVLTRYSFQSYNPLLGKALKDLSRIKEIKKEDLFNEIDGIPAMKRWVNQAKLESLEPNEGEFTTKKISLKNEDYTEVLIYSVLRLANNILRLEGKFLEINQKMCYEFIKKYPFKFNNLPLEMLRLKRKIRMGADISFDLKDKVINFIEQCENILRN